MLNTWTTELWMIRTASAFILSKHVFLLSFSYVPFFPSLLKAQISFLEIYLFRPCLYSYHLPPLFIFIKMDRKMQLKYVLFVVVYGDLRRIKRCSFLFLIFFSSSSNTTVRTQAVYSRYHHRYHYYDTEGKTRDQTVRCRTIRVH